MLATLSEPELRFKFGNILANQRQRFLYVLLENSTSVAALRLDGPGNASVVQIVDWRTPVEALGHAVGTY